MNKWEVIADMHYPRSTGFAYLFNNIIYICGGYFGPQLRRKVVEYYDEIKNSWYIADLKLNRGIE